MEKRFRKVGLLVISLIGLSSFMFSCSDDEGYDAYAQLEKDIATIDAYLTANNIATVKDPNGIRMEILELGTGLPAQISNGITIDYTGKLFATNETFESSTATGALAQYIDGWKVAFTTLPVGSRARLYIPSPLAYANSSYATIPPNSILIFDVNFKGITSLSSTETSTFKTDTGEIRKYIDVTKKIDGVVKDPTGLFYKITQEGSGGAPTWYDRLTLSYSIRLMSDETKVVVDVKDRAPTEDFYSRVVDYIHGMKIALLKMPVGTKATLYVPSIYAFGASDLYSNGALVVPANSRVIIEIEVKDID